MPTTDAANETKLGDGLLHELKEEPTERSQNTSSDVINEAIPPNDVLEEPDVNVNPPMNIEPVNPDEKKETLNNSTAFRGITSQDLNLIFEERRPVREPPSDDSDDISVVVRDLNTYITCAVCLGIIRQCHVVLNCLHRFCAKCIGDSLRFGKKECPQCRTHCPSKRSLRHDLVFDSIIELIYPDLDQIEAERENETERIIRASNVAQFAQSAIQGQKRQQKKAKHV